MKFTLVILLLFVFNSCTDQPELISLEENTVKMDKSTKPENQQGALTENQEKDSVKYVSGQYIESYYWGLVKEKLSKGKTLSESMELGYFSNDGITKVFIYLNGSENDFYYDLGTMESDLVFGKNGKLTGESVKDDFDYHFTEKNFIVDGGRGEFLSYEKFNTDIFDSLFYTKYAGNYSIVDSTGSRFVNFKYSGMIDNFIYGNYGLDKEDLGDFYFRMEGSDPIYFGESDTSRIVYDAVVNGDKIEFWNKRRVYVWEMDFGDEILSDTLEFTLIREKG